MVFGLTAISIVVLCEITISLVVVGIEDLDDDEVVLEGCVYGTFV